MPISAVAPRFLEHLPRLDRRRRALTLSMTLLAALGTTGAMAKPIVFAQPISAAPGDVISLTGVGFGTGPTVYLQVAKQSSTIALNTLAADDRSIVVRIPKDQPFAHYAISVRNGDEWSVPVPINVPRAMHYDRPEIAAGGRFRIFGRNLYLAKPGSDVAFVDPQSGATLPATIQTSTSDAYVLDVAAPAGLVPGTAYTIQVGNGFDTTTADKPLLGRSGGIDYFQLGLPWGVDFVTKDGPGYQKGVPGTNEADHHVFDITNDPALKLHAKGDGVTDATTAIQAAIDLVAKKSGGGIVYFPPGTYKLAVKNAVGITLKSGVVLKGQSSGNTKIVLGPDTPLPQGANYFAFYWPNGTDRSGLADLSIQNKDRTGQNIYNAVLNAGQPATRLFIQRVDWDLGSGQPITLRSGDKVAIENSSFYQTRNSHWPQATGDSGIGPLFFISVKNLFFKYNKVSWETGQNLMNDIDNAVIESNIFTRRATDQIVAGSAQTKWPVGGNLEPIRVGDIVQRGQGRQLSINFGLNVMIQNNTFKVSDGTLRHNWYDGETILSEGGGPLPRSDTGAVSSAGASTITDSSHCTSTCTWNLHPNSVVAIVSGKGTGQLRRITGRTNATLTIDKPWDIVPEPGDHFQTDVQTLENTIIRYNTLSDNPLGILLYGGNALNVSIVGNRFNDNGGILVRTHQMTPPSSWTSTSAKLIFNKMRNIEIARNMMVNTKSQFPAFIVNTFALVDSHAFWGTAADTIEIRNNFIGARPGTTPYVYAEGFVNNAEYHNPDGDYVENGRKAVIGTILQGNNCSNCPINYALTTGAHNTVIWNAGTTSGPGVTSQFVSDTKIWKTTPHASTGTVIGRD